MIIKFIAETEEEKKRLGHNVSLSGVESYFLMTDKKNFQGVNYLSWHGCYDFLIGNIEYLKMLIQRDFIYVECDKKTMML